MGCEYPQPPNRLWFHTEECCPLSGRAATGPGSGLQCLRAATCKDLNKQTNKQLRNKNCVHLYKYLHLYSNFIIKPCIISVSWHFYWVNIRLLVFLWGSGGDPKIIVVIKSIEFSCYTARKWNLPLLLEVKSDPSIRAFKSKLKTMLFTHS